ncbi:MAG: SdrD B-like domain-containing protein [Vicinamibacterales bacterium]
MTHLRSSRFIVAVLLTSTTLVFTEWRPRASGTISGVVFEDFNGNGLRDTTTTITNNGAGTVSAAVDRGVGGVTVTVFDGAGVVRGSATSAAATGAYSIAATGTGPYRVEFTNLPAGYFPSRFAAGATGNATTVQFVPDGDTPNVNLAILDPASFCQNNPTFAISCYVFGDQVTGPNAGLPVVVDFPYSAGASGTGATAYFQPQSHNLMVQAQQVGTTYGLAYAQGTGALFTSAFMKKHAGFGPGGPGAIYALDPTTLSGTPTLFASVPNAGADPHDPTDFNRDNGNAAWDAVGKISLGGLEVSPDGAFVYVVNLGDRRVYKIPTAGGAATSAAVPIPASAVPSTGADIRPFALQYYKGLLYVGMVNSAESTQSAANLRAYVYSLDPASMTFGSAPLLDISLQYPRGAVQRFDHLSAGNWLPWRGTFATNWTGTPNTANIDNVGTYPQPMLTGLAFDVDGNLMLGIRDRAGDQFGHYALDNPNDSLLWLGIAGGDTLLTELNVKGDLTSGWTLESNSQTTSFGPTQGAGNNQGPGGGEYFFSEFYFDAQSNVVLHEELNSGAVLQLPGFPDLMSSSLNPGLSTNAGGIMWLSRTPGLTTEGTKSKGYNLYSTPSAPNQNTFAKTNGLGEFVPICQAAPIEIGNRIWDDIDGDGVQDANEPGLDGVTVQLIAPGGAVLATVVTANGGQYYFSSTTIAGLTPNTAGYIVRVNASQGALGGRHLTVANSDATANGDSRDSDASLVGANAEIAVTTGAAGHNNHTYDIGFTTTTQTLALGDYVWYDTNNNGVVDAGEQPISGVDVVLFQDNGNGTFDALTDTVIASTQTAGGLYLFTGLQPGNYFVQIPASEFGPAQTLSGYQNSSGQTAGDFNNVDHGAPSPVPGQGIVSDLVTLTVNGEPTNDGDTDPNTNLTIDFGFYKLSLGNFVWFDANNNGLFDGGEQPATGIAVELLDAAGLNVLQTTATSGQGLYGFTGLTPGDYRVRITPPQNYRSSTGAANAYEPGPDPDNNVDNDDNGTNTGGTITSAPITLTPGQEPVVTNANGETSNPTVDFGLIQSALMSLGDLVWRDNNNDGHVSAGEPGIDGVTVRLYDGTGTTLLNTMQTAGGGFYLFTGLLPGDYVVEVVTPAGLSSSTGAGNAYEPAPDPDDDVNNDDNGTTQGAVVRSLPVTLAFNSEPVTDGDSDPNSNLTVDFGFFGQTGVVSLGNLVWWDGNRNAVADIGEIGLQGVTLRLIASNGTTVLGTTTTDVSGHYLFSNLQPGTYYVEVVAPQVGGAPFARPSSPDIASTPNPDNDTDNDDNGIGTSGAVFRSGAVTLTVGGEPTNDGDGDPDSNLTVDFGFVPDGENFQASMCLNQQVPSAIVAGSQFTASYTTQSSGPGQAQDVKIEGMLPPGITVVSTSPSAGGTCTVTPGMLECVWPGLTPVGPAGNRSVSVTFQASPSLPVGTPVQLWFMAVFDNNDQAAVDCSMVDGYPFIVDATTPLADLVVTANAVSSMGTGTSVPAPINQPVTTSFSVTNAGSLPASGLYAVLLDNPAGLSLAAATLTQGSATASSATTGTWDTGPIAPGATATLTMTFVPKTGGVTKASAIRFYGTPADPNATNDTAEFVIDAVGPGGGRSVAVGNIDGAAGAEIITGTGPGESPQVRVFSGTGAPMQSFYAFLRSFQGGVRVASCDVNGDGFDDVVAAQASGGGQVRVVSLAGGVVSSVVTFDAFESTFTGGVNVACADVDGDGRGEVIVAPAGGRAPDVRIYDVDVALAVMAGQFQAYESSFGGGVRVAAKAFTGSAIVGPFQIATMPGPGRPGELRVWSVGGGTGSMVAGAVIAPPNGSRVALGDADGDGGLDLLLMPDGGSGGLINIVSLTSGALVFGAPSGAAGFTSVDATVGVLAGGPGKPEVVVGRGPGEAPGIVSFMVMPGGAIVPRLVFFSLEVP